MTTEHTFDQCQADWLRLAGLVGKAKNADALAALLLADTAAPYHSFDLMAISTVLVNLGDQMGNLILDSLDEHTEEDKGPAA